MLVPSLPGQFTNIGLSSSQIPGGTTGSGGAGVVRVLAAGSYNATASDNGTTFVNPSGLASAATVVIPAGLPLGTTFSFYQISTTQNLVVQFSGTERLRSPSNTTGPGGTATWTGAGAASTGAAMMLRRVASPTDTNTDYAIMTFVQSLPVLA